ncbi:hypothetical protein BGY98DRAFT_954067 [Russula aff. rugulosa BPL654]|nr:hypothetical protein BGY98DRAFT_954067 [Russula aff. rugulosa BPL654]
MSFITTQSSQPFYPYLLSLILAHCCSYSGLDMVLVYILSLILSFEILCSLRHLLPCNIVPLVSTSFEEADTLLHHAEAINIPCVSEYREKLAILETKLLLIRMESHRSPGFFKQLYRLFLCGLTWRLFVLKSQFDAIRRGIELGLDERCLASHINTNAQSVTTAALPSSAAGTHLTYHDVRGMLRDGRFFQIRTFL